MNLRKPRRKYINERDFKARWKRNPRHGMKKDELYHARKRKGQKKLTMKRWFNGQKMGKD